MTKAVLAAALIGLTTVTSANPVAQWRPGGQMRIVLLVDSSSAVAPLITHFRAALNSFLDSLPAEPEIVLVTTGGQLRVRVGPTRDRAKLHDAASGFAADGGGNAFLDSLLEADRRFLKSAPDLRSVFVILTTDAGATLGDVRVDNYNRFLDQFIARGGRAHAIVIRGVNSGVTTQIAENFANNTGGYCEIVGIANSAPKLMKSLADYVAADL
jgi:hypothetical protein